MPPKARPERVDPTVGQAVMQETKDRQRSWTLYIIAHWRATGDLAPGCDARDWLAWFDGRRTKCT